ncbi:hypothetical protein WK58_10325 [Burkholderia ubonensis]|uniref:hypothetical protein n=1 Tax=Burkholderia ubonensis TaxID=101571 RepID=UPI00075EDA3E|nr:hypothetical protein [Burkholderia ubonensis]KVT77677.1 hypothetical protein WK58_10325 [Burkholderia ubonensis]
MADAKRASASASTAQIINLADFRKNPKTARKLSGEEKLREHERVFASLSFHLLSCARLIAALDEMGASHG